jgi:hypothetical protein
MANASKLKHWCKKGSHTCNAAFNSCLRRVLRLLSSFKTTLSRNLWNSSGVKRAKESSNVQCSNPELCWSTSVPGRRVHAHVSHRCPSAAMATAVRRRTPLAVPSTAGEQLNHHKVRRRLHHLPGVHKGRWRAPFTVRISTAIPGATGRISHYTGWQQTPQ